MFKGLYDIYLQYDEALREKYVDDRPVCQHISFFLFFFCGELNSAVKNYDPSKRSQKSSHEKIK
jgi:hypothetical protein